LSFAATKAGAIIRFRQFHEPTGKRIRYEKVAPGIGAGARRQSSSTGCVTGAGCTAAAHIPRRRSQTSLSRCRTDRPGRDIAGARCYPVADAARLCERAEAKWLRGWGAATQPHPDLLKRA